MVKTQRLSSVLLSFLALLCALVLFSPAVTAAAGDSWKNNAGDATYTEVTATTTNLYGVSYTQSAGTTEDGGNQNMSVFSMKTNGTTSKLVTWAATSGNDLYTRMSLSALATNYESLHPGWKVVAGINADQYFQKYGTGLGTDGSDKYTPAPYYPLIIDGETRFAITGSGTYSNYVGFTNDGATDGLVEAQTPSGYVLQVLDENGKVTMSTSVAGINTNANGIVVYAPVYDGGDGKTITQTLSNRTYYCVEKAELSYLSNSTAYASYKNVAAMNAFFGRGTISAIKTDVTLSNGSFAFSTTEPGLLSLLDVGTRVRVMMTYDGAMANVESASGYHTVQKKDGVEVNAANTYNSSGYPRSVFGQTADGTYVLLASDGHAYNSTNVVNGLAIQGMNYKQIDAVLNEYGVVDAYQDDGGGSVTAIVRNDAGGFTVTNSPSETNERSILSGLFFVVKDFSLSVATSALSANGVTLSVTANETAEALYAQIGSEKKEITDGSVTFTGLSSNTNYAVHYSYRLDGTEHEVITTTPIKTWKALPTNLAFTLLDDGTNVTISWTADDPDGAIQYVYVRLNDAHVSLTAAKPSAVIPLSKLKGSLWFGDGTFSIAIGDGTSTTVTIPKTTVAYVCWLRDAQSAQSAAVLK